MSSALLHDFDYERYPTADDHPFRGCEELRRRGYPEWVMRAILSHADYSGVPRESRWRRPCLRATRWPASSPPPRWCGRSKSVLDLEAASVIKRMKDKAFARAVSRDDLRAGAEELGCSLEEHVGNVIRFMRETGRRPRPAGNFLSDPPNVLNLVNHGPPDHR